MDSLSRWRGSYSFFRAGWNSCDWICDFLGLRSIASKANAIFWSIRQIANEPLKVCVSSEFATRHFAETINRPGRKLKFRGDGIEKLPIGFYGDLPEMQFYDVWANLIPLT